MIKKFGINGFGEYYIKYVEFMITYKLTKIEGIKEENMFEFEFYFWTILIVQGIIFGIASSYLAGQKNKNKGTWFFIGFFLSMIGLIMIAASKSEDDSTITNDGNDSNIIFSPIR